MLVMNTKITAIFELSKSSLAVIFVIKFQIFVSSIYFA